MRIRRALILLTAICIGLTPCCKGEHASVLPVTAFIIEPEGDAAAVFSEKITTFRISYQDREFVLPRAVNQVVLEHKAGELSSTVILRTGPSAYLTGTGRGRYLDATPYLDIHKMAVKEKAALFIKSGDPVGGISHFVHGHITDKKTGIPMLPASVILQNRAGDCTEHSILTAALLRAAGIPARCVTGVIMAEEFSGRRNVFVYHMWVEAYYGGRWILTDSTTPEDVHLNRYIAFAYHSLETEIPLEYIAAISSLTDVTIRRIR